MVAELGLLLGGGVEQLSGEKPQRFAIPVFYLQYRRGMGSIIERIDYCTCADSYMFHEPHLILMSSNP
ncbi:unnamed protein product [Tuber aestivum]|uniref:Uncharacterized protein n=1 Tax=Tuber aestivum TaxID=59557 RepID=A0A292PP11_9PEZI|nr:unnamed protein product [Tuber aestivum]